MNLLVTGGSGFIGSNFIRYLLTESGFSGRIINVDCLTYAGNPDNLDDIEKRFPNRYIFVRQDICRMEEMAKIFDYYQIEAVCHFAAESHVDRSIAAPDAFIQTNIIGTWNLLELARKRRQQIKRFHHISTDEVYGSLGKSGLFSEASPYQPTSPYSASKAASDHLVRAYFHTYGLPVTISNCSNNYGPYQFPEKLIPLMILNALEDKPLPVYGDGRHIRDWLYVRDHSAALWAILSSGRTGETYNIGGHCEIENIRLVENICDIMDSMQEPGLTGSRRELITYVADRPGHDRRYAIDASKISGELAWKPETPIQTGLQQTIEWYAANREWVGRVKSGEYRDWIKQQYNL
ncbi:MAG: dTDP-glucose 4,6-dehydratase [Desulfosalsimonadaceae bacterium]